MKTQTTLANVAEIITGPFGSMLHQSDYVSEGIPVIMPQDIGDRTLDKSAIAFVGDKDAERLSKYKVQENDIVYARRGDIEKHAYIKNGDIGALCGTGCMRVRVDKEKAHPSYISFYLNRPESKRWISNHAVGSNMPNLNTQILSNVPLELPSMEEQIKIARILDCFDNKLQLNKRICVELESMAKTIYDYWFTQFDFPNEEGKPYRFSGGEMEWNEQLKREIPKGWSVVPVIECYDVCYGFPFNTDFFVEDNTAMPVVRIRDIQECTTSAYTTEVVDNKYCLEFGDMIIGMDGNFHMNFWDSTLALLNQRCVRVRSTKEFPVYMAYFSSIPYIKAKEKTSHAQL